MLVKTHLPPLFRKKVKTALDTAQRCKSGLNSDLCYQVRQLWNKAYPQVRVRRPIGVSGVGYRLHLKPHALGGRQPAPEARSEVELITCFLPTSTSVNRVFDQLRPPRTDGRASGRGDPRTKKKSLNRGSRHCERCYLYCRLFLTAAVHASLLSVNRCRSSSDKNDTFSEPFTHVLVCLSTGRACQHRSIAIDPPSPPSWRGDVSLMCPRGPL